MPVLVSVPNLFYQLCQTLKAVDKSACVCVCVYLCLTVFLSAFLSA